MSETFRQIVHLLMGVIGAAVILSLDDRGAFIFVSAALVAQFLVCDAITRGYDIPVLSRVMDESERNEKVPLKGGIAYAAGALFCLAVFSREYTAVGLVTVGVLDSVSTLVGLRFGRHVVRGKHRPGAESPEVGSEAGEERGRGWGMGGHQHDAEIPRRTAQAQHQPRAIRRPGQPASIHQHLVKLVHQPAPREHVGSANAGLAPMPLTDQGDPRPRVAFAQGVQRGQHDQRVAQEAMGHEQNAVGIRRRDHSLRSLRRNST